MEVTDEYRPELSRNPRLKVGAVSHYKSNLRDIEFNLFEVFGGKDRFGHAPFEDVDVETAKALGYARDILGNELRSADQIVELFVTINAKHTKLNPSHLISLAGRRLYPDKALAASHDIIRALAENKDSPLHGEIKLFGVGRGRVAQAPLAEELRGVFTALDALGGRQADVFRENATRFFLNYFKQIARVFEKAWHGKRYSIKTATALRAFLRLVPDVLSAIRRAGDDPYEAASIHRAIAGWGSYVGDARFETEGEWRLKLAGGTRGSVDVLARELRSALNMG